MTSANEPTSGGVFEQQQLLEITAQAADAAMRSLVTSDTPRAFVIAGVEYAGGTHFTLARQLIEPHVQLDAVLYAIQQVIEVADYPGAVRLQLRIAALHLRAALDEIKFLQQPAPAEPAPE